MSQTLATVITGASSGIGEALARQLAAKEKQALVLVARRQEKLENLAAELRTKHGVRVEVIGLDLEQVGAATQLVKAVDTLGLSIDMLINNAGFGLNDNFGDMAIDRVQGMMQLNIVALTELTHAVLPKMRERKQGRVMNIASVAAFQACPNFAVYGATKSYVLMFSEALAAEEKKNGIKVIAVCPGATATAFHDVAGNHGTFLTKIMDAPETVAKTALCSMKCGCPMVVTGWLNKPLPYIVRLIPRQCMTWMAGKLAAR